MDNLRLLLGCAWLPILLAVWLLRFEETEKDRITKSQACARKSWAWWLLRLEEFIALGFSFGIVAAYVMLSYSVIGWEGSSDLRLPGWAWLVGLGIASLTVFVQYVAPDGRAEAFRTWGMDAFIVFFCALALMSQRDRTVALIQASAIWTFLTVVGVFFGVVFLVRFSERLTTDPATSVALPLCVVLLVMGEDQYPFPNTDYFLWPVVCGGFVLWVVRWLICKPLTAKLVAATCKGKLERRKSKKSSASQKKEPTRRIYPWLPPPRPATTTKPKPTTGAYHDETNPLLRFAQVEGL
jgi:hypothetical protein